MENPRIYGQVVDLIEERPVHKNAAGDLITGNTLQFVDLLLRNDAGHEKLVRVPVGREVTDFFAGA